jgi:23S rRNA pseudouridine2457 synthase
MRSFRSRAYVAGRLDADSEGLLILTDDGKLQARIADPKHKLEKTYWAQVEGLPEEALDRLRAGIALSDFTAQPAKVRVIDEPAGLWQRDPPIRYRAAIPRRGWKSASEKARIARSGA